MKIVFNFSNGIHLYSSILTDTVNQIHQGTACSKVMRIYKIDVPYLMFSKRKKFTDKLLHDIFDLLFRIISRDLCLIDDGLIYS